MCDQKLDVATVEAEAEPKSLTNIYYDCLERIFDFLDLESLLNVAGTCKRLQIAAAAKFADEYSHGYVRLHYGRDDINSIRYIYDPIEKSISAFGLKFCLTFLRYFGAKILHLSLASSMLSTRNGDRYVRRYINQYCGNTLISIRFERAGSFSSKIFAKPFKAVKKLSFYGCNLGVQLPNFVHWFPNLKHLSFRGLISIDDNTIAVSFPHLKHLGIPIDENRSGLCSVENVIKFVRANQQLQSLEIILCAKFDTLLDLISANKFILKLKVFGRITDVTNVQLNRLANEHPLLEELHFEYFFGFEGDDAIALIRQLNSLKWFEFRVKDQTDYDRFLNQLDSKWKHETKPFYGTSVIISLVHV